MQIHATVTQNLHALSLTASSVYTSTLNQFQSGFKSV